MDAVSLGSFTLRPFVSYRTGSSKASIGSVSVLWMAAVFLQCDEIERLASEVVEGNGQRAATSFGSAHHGQLWSWGRGVRILQIH